MLGEPVRGLQSLPSELLDTIFALLNADDLSNIGATCRLLHSHSLDDRLWRQLVQANVPTPIRIPWAWSFKDAYVAHYQHWFLTRHKIWIGSSEPTGSCIIALFNQSRFCIEAFSLAAHQASRSSAIITWDGAQVEYQEFNPYIYLDMHRTHLRLEWHNSTSATSTPTSDTNPFRPEIDMSFAPEGTRPIRHLFLHARDLPPEVAAVESVRVWPRRKIPAIGGKRIRTESGNCFRSSDHTPQSIRQASKTTFRLRQHVQAARIPTLPLLGYSRTRHSEIVTNYSTLPAECYTPTSEKPWQGIWCGDYNAHGNEFLLITQPDATTPMPAKAHKAFANWPRTEFEALQSVLEGVGDDGEDTSGDIDHTSGDMAGMTGESPGRGAETTSRDASDKAPYRGRLEAIKLTGDANVPRGEYTFIAEDIGQAGLIKYSHEPLFNKGLEAHSGSGKEAASAIMTSYLPNRMQEGARVVKSVGHIAGHGYTRDMYIPTQLILISENRLAQYWKAFQCISFYQRVDLDGLIRSGMTRTTDSDVKMKS